MQLIIFDLDGTLVDSQHEIVAAQRTAFAAVGLAPPSREASLSVVGLSLHEAFTALVGPQGPVDDLAMAYKAAWRMLRDAPGFQDRLYPGAAALVRKLAVRSDVRMGIATGKARPGVDRVLTANSWTSLFATIQTADVHPSKPDPAMLLAALSETEIPAAATLMIGDTTYDMEMAAAAGVTPVGVSWGYHPTAVLEAAGAAAMMTSFADLETYVWRQFEEDRPVDAR